MATLSNYALRLQTSLLDELRTVVEDEGTTLNQFVNAAVAEKLAALHYRALFPGAGRQRQPGRLPGYPRKGRDRFVVPGDELPPAS